MGRSQKARRNASSSAASMDEDTLLNAAIAENARATRLFAKVVDGDLEAVTALLKEGADPNAGTPRSKTRGLLKVRHAKTAKLWPGHILRLQSLPRSKTHKTPKRHLVSLVRFGARQTLPGHNLAVLA